MIKLPSTCREKIRTSPYKSISKLWITSIPILIHPSSFSSFIYLFFFSILTRFILTIIVYELLIRLRAKKWFFKSNFNIQWLFLTIFLSFFFFFFKLRLLQYFEWNIHWGETMKRNYNNSISVFKICLKWNYLKSIKQMARIN